MAKPANEPANEPDYGREARAAIDRALAILRAVEVTPDTAAQVLLADHAALVQLLGAAGALAMQIARVEAALTGLGMLLAGQPPTKMND